jgi:hypothetical protein
MSLTPHPDDGRICVADCGKPAPECHCKARYAKQYQDFVNDVLYATPKEPKA